MKILLINPPLREQYPPQSFPYGLGYVGKYLLKAGHQVDVLDIDTHRYGKERVLEELKKHDCDVIGTGGLVTVYHYLKWLVPNLRKIHPKARIIVGGSLPTSAPHDTLKGLDIDFIVLGEGERTGPELVNYLDKQKRPRVDELKKIKGIGFKYNGKIIITESRELIENLDEVGSPAWELFDTEKLIKKHMHSSMEIFTERGCPFNCNFCYHQFGYRPRKRSTENFVKEMKFLNKKYGVKHFIFGDNLTFLNTNDVLKFTKALKKYKLNITYDISMRASLVNEEIIKLLKKSSCILMNFGFESGSQKVLNLMNKRTTVEQMDNAIRTLEKNKMRYFGTFIIGYPGETKEDIDQTIGFCKRHGHLAKPFFATPYPGTPLFNQIKHKIKDMDKFLESLGDARNLVINISEFSTEELLRQRRRVVEETEKAYLKKHRILGFIFSPLKLLNIEVGFAVYAFLNTPFLSFVKMSSKTAWGYIKGKKIVPLSDEGYNKTFE
jgi:radical SAM superfamily enzyme YgiQ (UPF0313 family)